MRLTDLPAGSWSGSGHLNRCHEPLDAPPHPQKSVCLTPISTPMGYQAIILAFRYLFASICRGAAGCPRWFHTELVEPGETPRTPRLILGWQPGSRESPQDGQERGSSGESEAEGAQLPHSSDFNLRSWHCLQKLKAMPGPIRTAGRRQRRGSKTLRTCAFMLGAPPTRWRGPEMSCETPCTAIATSTSAAETTPRTSTTRWL